MIKYNRQNYDDAPQVVKEFLDKYKESNPEITFDESIGEHTTSLEQLFEVFARNNTLPVTCSCGCIKLKIESNNRK